MVIPLVICSHVHAWELGVSGEGMLVTKKWEESIFPAPGTRVEWKQSNDEVSYFFQMNGYYYIRNNSYLVPDSRYIDVQYLWMHLKAGGGLPLPFAENILKPEIRLHGGVLIDWIHAENSNQVALYPSLGTEIHIERRFTHRWGMNGYIGNQFMLSSALGFHSVYVGLGFVGYMR